MFGFGSELRGLDDAVQAAMGATNADPAEALRAYAVVQRPNGDSWYLLALGPNAIDVDGGGVDFTVTVTLDPTLRGVTIDIARQSALDAPIEVHFSVDSAVASPPPPYPSRPKPQELRTLFVALPRTTQFPQRVQVSARTAETGETVTTTMAISAQSGAPLTFELGSVRAPVEERPATVLVAPLNALAPTLPAWTANRAAAKTESFVTITPRNGVSVGSIDVLATLDITGSAAFAPTVRPFGAGAGLPATRHRYRVLYVYGATPGSLGPADWFDLANPRNIEIRLRDPSDTAVTARRLYRKSGADRRWRLVATLPGQGNVAYVDSQPNLSETPVPPDNRSVTYTAPSRLDLDLRVTDRGTEGPPIVDAWLVGLPRRFTVMVRHPVPAGQYGLVYDVDGSDSLASAEVLVPDLAAGDSPLKSLRALVANLPAMVGATVEIEGAERFSIDVAGAGTPIDSAERIGGLNLLLAPTPPTGLATPRQAVVAEIAATGVRAAAWGLRRLRVRRGYPGRRFTNATHVISAYAELATNGDFGRAGYLQPIRRSLRLNQEDGSSAISVRAGQLPDRLDLELATDPIFGVHAQGRVERIAVTREDRSTNGRIDVTIPRSPGQVTFEKTDEAITLETEGVIEGRVSLLMPRGLDPKDPDSQRRVVTHLRVDGKTTVQLPRPARVATGVALVGTSATRLVAPTVDQGVTGLSLSYITGPAAGQKRTIRAVEQSPFVTGVMLHFTAAFAPAPTAGDRWEMAGSHVELTTKDAASISGLLCLSGDENELQSARANPQVRSMSQPPASDGRPRDLLTARLDAVRTLKVDRGMTSYTVDAAFAVSRRRRSLGVSLMERPNLRAHRYKVRTVVSEVPDVNIVLDLLGASKVVGLTATGTTPGGFGQGRLWTESGDEVLGTNARGVSLLALNLDVIPQHLRLSLPAAVPGPTAVLDRSGTSMGDDIDSDWDLFVTDLEMQGRLEVSRLRKIGLKRLEGGDGVWTLADARRVIIDRTTDPATFGPAVRLYAPAQRPPGKGASIGVEVSDPFVVTADVRNYAGRLSQPTDGTPVRWDAVPAWVMEAEIQMLDYRGTWAMMDTIPPSRNFNQTGFWWLRAIGQEIYVFTTNLDFGNSPGGNRLFP